jgi:putative methyltransferase (TIGR04325 family)
MQPNVILFSSVIQYLKNPYKVLKQILQFGPKYVIFDRTAFIDKGNDRITIQKVSPEIYRASYPAWFLNRSKFLNFMEGKYELIAEFQSENGLKVRLGSRRGEFKGFIFKLKRDN